METGKMRPAEEERGRSGSRDAGPGCVDTGFLLPQGCVQSEPEAPSTAFSPSW